MFFWIIRVALFFALTLFGIQSAVVKLSPGAPPFPAAMGFYFLFFVLLLFHFRLVLSWSVQGKPARAAKQFLLWWWFLPPLQYYQLLVDILLTDEDTETAEAAINGAERFYAGFWTEFLRGNLERQRKNFPAAERHYQNAIQGAKTKYQKSLFQFELARTYIDHLYDRPDKLQAAVALVEESGPFLKKKGQINALVRGIEGALQVRLGNYQQGIDILRDTIPRTKSNSFMSPQILGFASEQLYYAGLAEKALGNYDYARTAFTFGRSLTKVKEINDLHERELKTLSKS